ncbi:F-box/kelch-repeat protein, partial [Dichanthelium oligosanthes]
MQVQEPKTNVAPSSIMMSSMFNHYVLIDINLDNSNIKVYDSKRTHCGKIHPLINLLNIWPPRLLGAYLSTSAGPAPRLRFLPIRPVPELSATARRAGSFFDAFKGSAASVSTDATRPHRHAGTAPRLLSSSTEELSVDVDHAGLLIRHLPFTDADWSQDADQAPLFPFHGRPADAVAAVAGPELIQADHLASFRLDAGFRVPGRIWGIGGGGERLESQVPSPFLIRTSVHPGMVYPMLSMDTEEWELYPPPCIGAQIIEYTAISEDGDDQERDSAVSLDAILPDDLLEKVLSMLPVVSVIRSESICKRWHQAVRVLRCTLNRMMPQKPWYFMFTCSDEVVSGFAYDPSLRKWYSFDFPCIEKSNWSASSSDGLVCLMDSDNRSRVFVCNPITKDWKRLADAPGGRSADYSALAISGFGEFDDVFASSGADDLIYIQSYGSPALLTFDMSQKLWK